MIFQEMLKDEREAGRAEGQAIGQALGKAEEVLGFLQELGTVSDDLKDRIMTETDLERLKKWIKLAARAASIDEFVNKISD